MRPWVCESCGTEVPEPHKRCEERTEYRREDRSKSIASFTRRKLCLDCVRTAVEVERMPHGRQGALSL